MAALLVPMPTIVAASRNIFETHTPIEVGPGGLYKQCEILVGAEGDPIFARLSCALAAKVAPHMAALRVIAATRRALARAGYDLAV
jgi:hypothetical protein